MFKEGGNYREQAVTATLCSRRGTRTPVENHRKTKEQGMKKSRVLEGARNHGGVVLPTEGQIVRNKRRREDG